MASFKRHIPNFITALGLLSGCLSIVYSSRENLKLAVIFILVAALFDFVDGWVARLLNSISDFGKQLDSLSDVISFGVAPSFIMYKLMIYSLVESSSQFNIEASTPAQTILLFSTFLIAVFAALRLAKFNIDITQKESFRGLPTPASALFVAALGYLIDQKDFSLESTVLKPWFLALFIFVICWLMVSKIPMFSLKFKSYGIRENLLRYLLLLFAIILIVAFGVPGIIPVILLYILLSLIAPLFRSTARGSE
jgi:CDP-diacylglycerol---serine O-phosphatidyltransferase